MWTNDDIVYRFHFLTGEPIKKWSEVFSSQWAHYFMRNGRFPAHVLAQASIALWGRFLFAVAAGVVYAVFVSLLWLYCRIGRSWKYALLVALLAFLGLQTKYTPCFQINYIWMFSLVLGYLWLFFCFREQHSRKWAVGLVPFSLVAGWSNEALVVGISVSLIVYVCQHWRNLTFNQWTMFFSFGVGVGLVCLSPATIGRTGDEVGSVDFLPPGVYSLVKLLYYSRVTYLLVFYVAYLKLFRNVRWRDLYHDGAFYIHAFVALLLFNLAIGVFGNRQLFGMELMAIVLLVTYWKKYTKEGRALNVALVLLSLWAVYKVCFNYSFLQRQHRMFDYFYEEYRKSPDGTVFYDLSRDDVTYYETYPSDVFTTLVIQSMDRYFHYVGDDKGKTFKVLPTCCKRMETYVGNHYEQSASGAWTVVVVKSDEPVRMAQTRKIECLGWECPFASRPVTVKNLTYENTTHKVYQLYDKMPFVVGTGVEFFED